MQRKVESPPRSRGSSVRVGGDHDERTDLENVSKSTKPRCLDDRILAEQVEGKDPFSRLG